MNTSLSSFGSSYRWLLVYYRELACSLLRVRDEFSSAGWTPLPSGLLELRRDSRPELRDYVILSHAYQWQFFALRDANAPRKDCAIDDSMLCVGVDRIAPTAESVPSPCVHMIRFSATPGLTSTALRRVAVDLITSKHQAELQDGWWRSALPAASGKAIPLQTFRSAGDLATRVVTWLLEQDVKEREATRIG